ncbi:MAG: multicopper oxidase family protein [Alphaproteobacteria bacterium]|nr:multicopper oxidase family protein [Alphaproteobacteria bacterium]
MSFISRRTLLKLGITSYIGTKLFHPLYAQTSNPTYLNIDYKTLEIKGKAAKLYGLFQNNGKEGLFLKQNDGFNIHLTNKIEEPSLIHWHGLTPPAALDGVPHLYQDPLLLNQTYQYSFPLKKSGTNWMHSHMGMQEQSLLAAPLIIYDDKDPYKNVQEIIYMIHDFSYKKPEELLHTLHQQSPTNHQHHQSVMDLHDIAYDAHLVNDRTLDDPQIVPIDKGDVIRLRIINAASSTNYFIDLGSLTATLIAVDGISIVPLKGKIFPLAMAQRLDLIIHLPREEGSYPILARLEGQPTQTGLILKSKSSYIKKIPETNNKPADIVGIQLEQNLKALNSLVVFSDHKTNTAYFTIKLIGDMAPYNWGFDIYNHQTKDNNFHVTHNDWVEIFLSNQSMMSHPIHLHGHHFQILEINEKKIQGAVRDTILVPAGQNITIGFHANNPGVWAFHCHHLYHMVSGMMTHLKYI